MQTVLNLAYGSNLHRARIEARISVREVLGTVLLPNWGLRFHKQGSDDSGKCNLIESPGEVAFGLVYAFSAKDKARLDEIEGVGKGYQNVALPMQGFDLGTTGLNGNEEVFAYLALDTHVDDTLVPYDWYHSFVRRGAEKCNFPVEYLSHIDSFAARRDPNESRRKQNIDILNAL
ncbi:MAG: gamma-glutamylcyclotransferase [Gammaproteobacteria bacterium]